MKKTTESPAIKQPDSDALFDEPGQDESGKTAAPQSRQGPETTQHCSSGKPSAAPAEADRSTS